MSLFHRESIRGYEGQPLLEVGLSNGGSRAVTLDRDATLCVGGNYIIDGVMYRVKSIVGSNVYIQSI